MRIASHFKCQRPFQFAMFDPARTVSECKQDGGEVLTIRTPG